MSRRQRSALMALGTLALSALLALAIDARVHGGAGSELRIPLGPRTIELLAPRALRGLALLPLLVLASFWSLADLTPARRLLSTLLRGALIALLALALARPAERGLTTRTSTVFVVDVSDSVSDAELAAVGARIDQARTLRGEHHVALLTFARTATQVALDDATPVRLERHADGSASNLDAALGLALGLFAPGHLRQAVLFSDGRETHGDLQRAAERLAAQNVQLLVRWPQAAPPGEVAVESLALPERLQVGEPFTIRVAITSSVARRARVRLLQNGLLNGLDGVRDVALEAGQNQLSFRSIVRVSGPVSYRVELEPEGPDRFATNNAFTRATIVQGKPRVLYAEGMRGEAEDFRALLSAAGFEVEVRASEGFPSSASELSAYDFVVLSDVPREALSQAAMQAIERYVEEGGGFLMAGGQQSFGLGGYRGSKLESILPVRLDTERRRDQPSLALVLVIDKSGSMSGDKIELAKEAARATSELLGGEDYLGVIGFDAEPMRVVRLATAENRLGIARGIGKLAAGGGTLIFPALDAAYADLSSVRARLKHVILLTDGQTQESGIPVLVQNMQVDGITVSAIGLGDDVNRSLIEEVARLGRGRAYFTADPASIPRLFVRETHAVARSSAVEDYVGAQVASRADFLRSLPMAQAPMLRGYVATRARPEPAQVVLISDLGEPLLARMHVGLGWSLAWTSDVKPRWSAGWFRWSAHSAFWAQLIREHMRKSRASLLPVQARLDGDELVASVDALDANERFVNGLSGSLRVDREGAGEAQLTAALRQSAPGRYEARVRLPGPGNYRLEAQLGREGAPRVSAAGDVALPFPREYVELTPAPAVLLTAAERTGGGHLPADAELFQARGRVAPVLEERWPWLVWCALVLFLADVAARRVRARSPRRS